MERYTINGHDFEYDTFDLVNLELMGSEMEKIKELGKTATGIDSMRILCESITDMFDLLIGEGTSRIAFGEHLNLKEVLESFSKFSKDITAAVNGIGDGLKGTVVPVQPVMNREQKRAEERAKKRSEAKLRVESRGQ